MATFTVTTTSDSGAGSLREAVALANANADADTIVFAAGLAGSSIGTAGGQLVLSNDVTIDGDVNGDNKADITILGGANRIFDVSGAGVDVDLVSLTLDGGYDTSAGGGVRSGVGTTLDIFDTTFKLCGAGTTGLGGAIFAGGALTVANSLLWGNSAGTGGGVFVAAGQSAVFINTTIDNNSAAVSGGGISTGSGAYLGLLNSTITANQVLNGNPGSGIELLNGSTAVITNSVVALNTGAGNASIVETGTASTVIARNSFFGTTVAIDTDNGGNINNGGDPLLGPTTLNLSPLGPRNILENSPLRNAGDTAAAAGFTTDANGNNRNVAGTVDIGATEFQLVVTTAADVVNATDGVFSLREAVALANLHAGADTITFATALAEQTITLNGTQLALTADVTIDGDVSGDGKADITISGNNQSRIFGATAAGTDVVLRALLLTNGNAGAGNNGGAISVTGAGGSLSLDRVTITTSTAADGGAIAVNGVSATIRNSLITGNSASDSGGGIYTAGNALTVTNTTIHGNSANGLGGGIGANGSTLTLNSSTLTGNRADADGVTATAGGGISRSGGALTVTNSVVADNLSGNGVVEHDVNGAVTTANTSVFGTAVTITTNNGSSTGVANVDLGALQDNGGPVMTRNINAGSVLIDAGNSSSPGLPATDANGRDRTVGAATDIGATESQLVVTTAADVVNAADGVLSLREAVALANLNADADSITFAATLAGQTITLNGTQLALTADVTIDGDVNGDNRADITISGNNASRIFDATTAGADVALASLTLTNGRSTTAGGGAVRSAAGTTLSISDTTIKNSVAVGASPFGGGGIRADGTLSVINSTITNNSAANGGGVYVQFGGLTATFVNTTIDGNTATADGGGIATGTDATLIIRNSTITSNSAAGTGGGIDLYNSSDATITNSVIALNTGGGNTTLSESGANNSTVAAQNSFFGTSIADVTNGVNGNIVGGSPGLGALQDNGGTVHTRNINTGSVLIDSGSRLIADSNPLSMIAVPGLTASDANGRDRGVGAAVDMGATEYQLVVTTASDDAFGGGTLAAEAADGGGLSLREAVALASANADADTITFAQSLAGQTLVLTGGELDLNHRTTIDGDINGDNKADITISGNNASRIFKIEGFSDNVDLLSLSLTGGNVGGYETGGAIRAHSFNSLVLRDVTISDSAAYGGGGLRAFGGRVSLVNTLVTGNTSIGTGGGIEVISCLLAMTNTTVHGNRTIGAVANNDGGGLYANSSIVNIHSSTITGNRVDTQNHNTVRSGAGVELAFAISTTVTNSVIADNYEGSGTVEDNFSGIITTATNSIFGDDFHVFFNITNNIGSQVNVANVGLGALLDNGGTTLTRSPLDGSVLIGAGANGALPLDVNDLDGDGNTLEALPRDGRGGIRKVGGTVDVGAVEQIVDETISGTAAGDTILGGLGNDILRGRGGSDTLNGGGGTSDTADYSQATGTGVTVNLGILVAQLISASEGSDTLIGIENVIGSAQGDTLTGNSSVNILIGNAGVDVLNGASNADRLIGGDGDDVYYIDNTDQVTEGNGAASGIDTIYARFNVNLASYANVENLVLYGGGPTSGTGTAVNNVMNAFGNTNGVTFTGLAGDDVLRGSQYADTLIGGTGKDILIGNAALGGINTMTGGDNDDAYYSSRATDVINENLNEGFDIVFAIVNRTLSANTEYLYIYGTATSGTGNSLANTINGFNSAQSLTLDGAQGNDVIYGSNQADIIIGGANDDIMNGYGGADTFRFTAAGTGADQIYGFDADPVGGQDRIDVSGRGFSAASIGGAIVIATAGADTLITIGADTIRLIGVASANVTATDFLF